MKAGEIAKVVGPATAIAAAAEKMGPLFPPESEHPKSRAKAEIWQTPDLFDAEIKMLRGTATALAKAAEENIDVPQAANGLFSACKSCHTKFRVPED